MIEEISKFIEQKTSFKVGTTLQVGRFIQDSLDRCSAVQETSGGGVFPELPDRIDAMIYITSRAKTQMQARDDSWEIFTAIHGTAGWKLPNLNSHEYEVAFIEAATPPQYIGEDERGRFMFSTIYIFRIKDADK